MLSLRSTKGSSRNESQLLRNCLYHCMCIWGAFVYVLCGTRPWPWIFVVCCCSAATPDHDVCVWAGVSGRSADVDGRRWPEAVHAGGGGVVGGGVKADGDRRCSDDVHVDLVAAAVRRDGRRVLWGESRQEGWVASNGSWQNRRHRMSEQQKQWVLFVVQFLARV